jgi:hypothetical protein
VHPILAYATGDAYTEILIPCQWYVFGAAVRVALEYDWKPIPYEAWLAKQKK